MTRERIPEVGEALMQAASELSADWDIPFAAGSTAARG